MSYLNQDWTLHQLHNEVNENCEYCDEKEQSIIQSWYLKHWITYKEYLRLTGLVF